MKASRRPDASPELSAEEGGLRIVGGVPRCGWCSADPEYLAYHDTEWGVPLHDEERLFELLLLEGFQAGLSWITILKKRPAFAAAFGGWEPARLARLTQRQLASILDAPGIVRNRLKIAAVPKNAAAFLRVQQECGGFSRYLWGFTGGEVICPTPRWRSWREAPTQTALSQQVSRDLKKRGFLFCGPVIVYSYLQAAGIIDDHMAGCFCACATGSRQVKKESR